MSAAHKLNDCARLARCLGAYVDGELDASHATDIEQHADACSGCAERVASLRALRHSLKRSMTKVRAPEALRERLCQKLREPTSQPVRVHVRLPSNDDGGSKWTRGHYAVGLAAAAGIAFAFGMTDDRQSTRQNLMEVSATPSSTSVAGLFDSLLEDLVDLHANPLPPETTNPDDLPRWDPLVGVRIPKPKFQPFGASFKGARVYGSAQRRAAALEYMVLGGHRVTMYVFNPRAIPVKPTRLSPRKLQQRAILTGKMRGYSVAAVDQGGVGYAFASDLDDDKSTQLVLSALQQ